MSMPLRTALAALFLAVCAAAQTPTPDQPPSQAQPNQAQATQARPGAQPGYLDTSEEPFYVELGGFSNFVDNGYGQWSGASGKIMYRGAKHFAPIFGFATQTRPEGTQSTLGVDSYISFNKWFYMIAGVGGSPQGSAVLWPKLRYGAEGMITVPKAKGLVATLAAAQIHGEGGSYGRILSAGAMYYRGRAIWTGYVSFNRSYPGAIPSKSGGIAVQYGAQKHYWIGGGIGGGRIAYQTIDLTPLNVRYLTFGPNIFFQKWLTRKVGFIAKYDYQNELDAYQRHGIAGSVFFEIP